MDLKLGLTTSQSEAVISLAFFSSLSASEKKDQTLSIASRSSGVKAKVQWTSQRSLLKYALRASPFSECLTFIYGFEVWFCTGVLIGLLVRLACDLRPPLLSGLSVWLAPLSRKASLSFFISRNYYFHLIGENEYSSKRRERRAPPRQEPERNQETL